MRVSTSIRDPTFSACLHRPNTIFILDFTRLKLVKAKKLVQQADEASRKAAEGSGCIKENDEDITAAYDASDDADVVF